jgi:hypothetical protein
MTAKDKAIELVHKYVKLTDGWVYGIASWEHKKKCALIAVDEIIEAIDFDWMEVQNLESEHRYWQEVKQEIEKL